MDGKFIPLCFVSGVPLFRLQAFDQYASDMQGIQMICQEAEEVTCNPWVFSAILNVENLWALTLGGGGDVWRFAAQDQSNQCMDQRQYDRTDGVTRLLATDDKFLRRWTKQVMLNELKGNSSSITSMMLP